MALIIIRYHHISIIEVSPLAPHRVRFAPQNRLFGSADCTIFWEHFFKLFNELWGKFLDKTKSDPLYNKFVFSSTMYCIEGGK